MSVPEVVKGGFTFTVAADVLTIAAKGVTKVRFPKAATPGDWVVLDLTGKSYSVDFNTYPVDSGCGLTTTVNWANTLPAFVFLGNEDNTAANVFAFNTRNPRMVVTPAAGLINDTDAVGATAQSQNHINSFKADDAGIAAKPCICIGSHTMTWDTADDRWTLVALTTSDGFGKFNSSTLFTMPAGQNGNAASKFFADNTGTAPAGTTQVATYSVTSEGLIQYRVGINGGDLNGAGDVTLYANLPYKIATSTGYSTGAGIMFLAAGATMNPLVVIGYGGDAYCAFYRGTSTAALWNSGLDENGDLIEFSLIYPAF